MKLFIMSIKIKLSRHPCFPYYLDVVDNMQIAECSVLFCVKV